MQMSLMMLAKYFAFYANKIGEERSFFYIAWALVEEEKKRYPLADKIYCRGLALGANLKCVGN